MKPYKRIIAGFLAIATLSANIIAASADVSSDPGVKVGWWTAQLHNLAQRSDGLSIKEIPYGSWLCSIAASLSGKVCEFSDDHWHHADESHYIKISEGKDGTYGVRATCQYCSKEFAVGGLTADDLSSKYNDYVSTLPASGYDSAGKLLWQPRWIEDTSVWGLYVTNVINSTIDGYVRSDAKTNVTVSGTQITIGFLDEDVSRGLSLRADCTSGAWHQFRAPIDGTYDLLASDFYDGNLLISGKWKTMSVDWLPVKSMGAVAGGNVSLNGAWKYSSSKKYDDFAYVSGGSLTLNTPVFSITPVKASSTTVNNTYNINTRVNNFNGDYYDSVTNNYYNNTTIINETTNNYYDMTTNNYYTMSNWSYDYQSRTYFVTLEDGTTITVQFGDDCLTITNNNVENSYQYVIKNGGGSDPDTPTTCKHNWTETIDVEPTCLEGGHANFTCSLCGETYEQILSAKGHNWTVKEHVNTVYGENGEIVTQGHTLYECSTCGEQWYTETAAPPPDVSGSSSIRSWLQAFQLWLDGKLDSLFSAADAVIITKLDVLIQKSSDSIVYVMEDDTYIPSVLHLDDENGMVDTTKNGVSIFGDLLRWLWKNVFDGAFKAADITKLDGLFYDPTEVTTDGS